MLMTYRRIGRFITAILFLTLSESQVVAQQVPQSRSVEPSTLPRRFMRDELRLWTNPFRKDTYGSHALTKYGIPFALISAGLIASDRRTGRWLPNTSDQTLWSSRVSNLG